MIPQRDIDELVRLSHDMDDLHDALMIQNIATPDGPPLRIRHPSDAIAADQAPAAGRAYRTALAPFRALVADAASPEDALRRLQQFLPHWHATPLVDALDASLQVCAAAGATASRRSSRREEAP